MRLALGTGSVDLPADVAGALEAIVPEPAAGPPADLPALAAELVARAAPRAGRPVLLAVPDRTRAFPLARALDAVGAALAGAGIGPGDCTIAIASGSHVATEADRDPARLGGWARGARVLAHRPEDATASLGTSRFGTPVAVHPALVEAATVLAVGPTAFHYFAGFGGGPKMLVPGLAARATIAANHRRSLGPWPPGGLAPGVEPGRLAGNAVAEDLAAIAELLPPSHHLTTWDDARAGAAWSARAEFVAATERFAQRRRQGPGRRFDVVVASAGGHPRDVDVVQAHKALFHAALYASPGASIVLAAACPEGLGSAALAGWLALADAVGREARARTEYDLNAQTAISLAGIASRFRVTWVGAGVAPELVRLGIVPATDVAAAARAALAHARAERGAAARALALPVATDVVPAAIP